MIRRETKKKDQIRITFALPETQVHGRVSVVGDFNDWTPGVHTLIRRANGTRSVAVNVRSGSAYRFRYLGEGGNWFDDPDVDAREHDNGVLHV